MAKKPTKRREANDPSLAFRAVEDVIERTETRRDKHPVKPDATNLKQRFDAAHQKGMEALKHGDLKSFGAAIEEEREIIKKLPTPLDVIKPPANVKFVASLGQLSATRHFCNSINVRFLLAF